MSVEQTTRTVINFGPFEVDTRTQELKKHGVRLRLPGQSFQILTMLLQKPGQLVAREELQQALWPADTHVDFERGVNAAVNRLREVLGDSADHPKLIETLPRRGYRWIFPIAPVEISGFHALGGHSKNVLAVLTILALVLGGYFYFRQPKLTRRDTVVLADFVNGTNELVFDGTLKQALASDLQQSPFLNIYSQASFQQALAYMRHSRDESVSPAVAREVCERNGIKALIAGEISRIGEQYVLTVIATNCLSGDTLAQEQTQAMSKEGVLPALSNAARKIRSALGESLASVQQFDAPIYQATTASLEALQAYTLGEETRARENDLAAIPYYERAIEIDPDFVTAYSILGTIYRNTGDHRRALEYQTKAFERRERTSQYERFYITARYFGDVTGEVDKEIATYELWRKTFPRDYVPIANLGETYRDLGDPERGLSLELEAMKLAPHDTIAYDQASTAFEDMNRLDEAKTLVKQAIAIGMDTIYMHSHLYWIAFVEGDDFAMQHEVEWARGRREEWQMSFLQALVAGAQGKVNEFRLLSQQAYEGALRQKSTGMAARFAAIRASEEVIFGYPGDARRWATEAQRLSQNELAQVPAILAFAGDSARAESVASDLRTRHAADTLLNERDLPQVRAAILISSGDGVAAIDALQPTLRFVKTTVTPSYARGLAYLQISQGKKAEDEFQQIINRKGVLPLALEHPIAHLGLGRAYTLQGNEVRAREEYIKFLTLWKNADPGVPIFKQAKMEFERLQ
jgi:DNA-binding winged helix-turn-helix (wHTH) protein/tetratricopeptide (TPR) repeat protein